jgi:phytoene dehydrogenase-like protein/NAD(P)H-flavin reductase
MESNWDAIVIGSGVGGLTAAGLLAGVAGMKVLVLERHSEPGGQSHVFRRDGASWDVGLHYVGGMNEGSRMRAFFDYLSLGQLRWNRMPYEFERFIYPGLDFSVPSDPRTYEERVVARFPEEASAIRRYFLDVRAVQRWSGLSFLQAFMPRPLSFLIRQYQMLTRSKAVQTTADYLNSNFRSPMLRALLASQWGDYGLPPSQSAFAMHAQIVAHYRYGAWFPEGGSGRIARTFERGIEQAGGSVLVCQEVTSIITKDGRATGVRALDTRGVAPVEVSYQAPIIISNVGAPLTFEKLLGRDGDLGARTASVRHLVKQLEGGTSAVTLYLRLKAPISTLSIQGENYWINTTTDHESVAAQGSGIIQGQPRHIYLSFPSAKSGDEKFHTAEIVSLVDYREFAAWREQPKGNRGRDYSELKDRISDGLLKLAEAAVPGLTALVIYRELATPLTMEHYTSHPSGRFYGLPTSPARFKAPPLGPRTPVAGLYLSGSDAGCPGIVGAMMGGVAAAAQALGRKGFARIVATLQSGNRNTEPMALPAQKKRATLVSKTALTASIWKLEFRLEEDVDFMPGQFARIRVADYEWRDYSIAAAHGPLLSFLISNRTGGHGSDYVNSVEVGARTEIELPLGHYTLHGNGRRKIFVATGTGLAPFLPMFEQLRSDGTLETAELLFGCKTQADNISHHYRDVMPKTLVCISREAGPAASFGGRVSDALGGLKFDPEATDFYLCGSAAMVADCKSILERAGATRIYVVAY